MTWIVASAQPRKNKATEREGIYTPRLLTPNEAAAILEMHPKTLIKWAREGYVPGHPLGEGKRRLWRFFEAEIVNWVEGRKNGGKPNA